MSYHDFLAARGYRRVQVERTEKAPGDLVLTASGAKRVEAPDKVVSMRRGKAAA